MSLQISLTSIFSQEEILKHEELMLTSKMNQIKNQSHTFLTLKNEKSRIIKMIDERLFKAVDIKTLLLQEISKQDELNEENKYTKKKCSLRLTELLIKKEEIMIQKQKQKDEIEKEENHDDK